VFVQIPETKGDDSGRLTSRESADLSYWIVDGGGTKVFERKDTIPPR
jgi:hypothetical protein